MKSRSLYLILLLLIISVDMASSACSLEENEVTVQSGNNQDPVKINGSTVTGFGGPIAAGINFYVFHYGELSYWKTYNVQKSVQEVKDMNEFINNLKEGTEVFVACFESCSPNMEKNGGFNSLKKLGYSGKPFGHMEMLTMAGQKGASPDSAPAMLSGAGTQPGITKCLPRTCQNGNIYQVGAGYALQYHTTVNGKNFKTPYVRGLAVFVYENGNIADYQWFDTHQHASSNKKFQDWYSSVLNGAHISISCQDACVNAMDKQTKTILQQLGFKQYSQVGIRDGFILDAIKGEGLIDYSFDNRDAKSAIALGICSEIPEDDCQGDDIKIVSAGFADGNYVQIHMNGQKQKNIKAETGINFYIFSHQKIVEHQSFFVQKSAQVVKDMIDYIDDISPDTLVAIACKDECSKNMNTQAYEALQSLGFIKNFQIIGKSSYAALGQKGAQSKDIKQQLVQEGSGVASVESCLNQKRCEVNHSVMSLVIDQSEAVLTLQKAKKLSTKQGLNLYVIQEGKIHSQLNLDVQGNKKDADELQQWYNKLAENTQVITVCLSKCGIGMDSLKVLQGFGMKSVPSDGDVFAVIGNKGNDDSFDSQDGLRKASEKGVIRLSTCINANFKTDNSCARLYTDCNFKGRSLEVCDDVPDITFEIKSIFLPEGAKMTFYHQPNFAGDKFEFKENVECLNNPINFQSFIEQKFTEFVQNKLN